MITINRQLLAYDNILKYQEDDDLDWLTIAKTDWGGLDIEHFLSVVEQITGEYFITCDECRVVERESDSYAVQRWQYQYHLYRYVQQQVCSSCAEDYTTCDDCGELADNLERIAGNNVCKTCCDENYYTCNCCGNRVHSYGISGVGGDSVCDGCLEIYYEWCEHCDEYRYGGCRNHHECQCEAPRRSFAFPNNGTSVHEDDRFTVELPAGVVDEVGIEMITGLLRELRCEFTYVDSFGEKNTRTYNLAYEELNLIFEKVGTEWQGKRGNLTKRLSSALYKKYKVKIPADMMTQIGNIAKQHSANSSEYHIELTRDLNLSAAEFYHEDSCWWGGYSESRCALKSWGGIGLRSYDSMTEDPGYPEGRAWVQPLNADLKPTHDAKNAAAYIVYNGYGEMSGYTPARIIAQMTGMTYKKINFSASPQYVNSGIGYLVASAETCAKTAEVWFHGNTHNKRDADELTRREQESWERIAKLNEQYAGLDLTVEMFSNQITDNLSSIQIGVMA